MHSGSQKVDLAGLPVDSPDNESAWYRSLFHQIFENSPDGIALLDADGAIQSVNSAFLRLFRCIEIEALGRSVVEATAISCAATDACRPLDLMRSKGWLKRDAIVKRDGGRDLYLSVLGFAVPAGQAEFNYVVTFRDITPERHVAYEIARQTDRDDLTDVFTRREFERRFQEALNSNPSSSFKGGLLYLDVDHFQLVNDRSGFLVGDSILQQLAMLIRQIVGSETAVARLVGDEFGVFFLNHTLQQVQELAGAVLAGTSEHRFEFQNARFALTASIGLVEISDREADFQQLIGEADIACRAAKEKGRNRVCLYRPEDREVRRHRHDSNWLLHLQDALDQDRFLLYRQSIKPIRPNGHESFHGEILLRIRQEDGAIALPSLFIPAAERYHLMPRLDRYVVQRVLSQLAELPFADNQEIIGVNLSGETIADSEFTQYVKELFNVTNVPPASICFEITETATIADMERAADFVQKMRQLGCSVALDDFGAGMATFEYLKRLEIDYLKIDKLFIHDLTDNPVGCEMVKAITTMAKAVGVKTIAEHVQTDGILNELRNLDVDYVQGYAIHVPEPWGNMP